VRPMRLIRGCGRLTRRYEDGFGGDSSGSDHQEITMRDCPKCGGKTRFMPIVSGHIIQCVECFYILRPAEE